ncbi:MAG TPA: cytochrome c1 [Terriglobia bacterium]|nr:cytochrome c1 [Terriglobia bacterium]
MSVGSAILKLATAALGVAAVAFIMAEPGGHLDIPQQKWSFDGFFGSYDRTDLRHGFQVYSEVCSGCHSMNLESYRNLEEIGFTPDEVAAIAAKVQVQNEDPNDQGEMFERPGKASDHFKAPFPNEQAARAANNGALPPDMSLLAKSRAGKGFGGYNGADYIYALMHGYSEPPADVKLNPGMNYNKYFKGHQIGMPQPLQDNSVTFADGAPATLDEEAKAIATFLTWVSESNLEQRKHTGLKAMLFLVAFTLLAYAAKRKVWKHVH